jgi:hypothetical protein
MCKVWEISLSRDLTKLNKQGRKITTLCLTPQPNNLTLQVRQKTLPEVTLSKELTSSQITRLQHQNSNKTLSLVISS